MNRSDSKMTPDAVVHLALGRGDHLLFYEGDRFVFGRQYAAAAMGEIWRDQLRVIFPTVKTFPHIIGCLVK